jgi:hypothetical protein
MVVGSYFGFRISDFEFRKAIKNKKTRELEERRKWKIENGKYAIFGCRLRRAMIVWLNEISFR